MGGKQFVVCPGPFPEFSGYIPGNGHATLFGCTAETELKIWCTELLIMQFRGTKHIMDIIFFSQANALLCKINRNQFIINKDS